MAFQTNNWSNVDKDAMLAAAVDSVDNDYAFKDILIKCIDGCQGDGFLDNFS